MIPILPWRALAAALLACAGAVRAAPAATPPAAEPPAPTPAVAAAPPVSMGLQQLPPTGDDGPVTVYYPSSAAPQAIRRGPFTLVLAERGAPRPGNGRLVVLSHGSGGGPWVHADLARVLVARGYVVAVPEHQGDNSRDPGRPGPDSWKQRPAEVSRAIDAVAADVRLAQLLQLDRVGVWGQSAGGHTALTLAGGRWSEAGFRDHCLAHAADDFNACVGLFTRLTGGWADGFKTWLARTVIGLRFSDPQPQQHEDARIAAVVAGNPFAADFDFASFAAPRVPLALVTTGRDRWLVPRFHSARVLAACPRCEHLADLPEAGHGALLSPLPPGLDGLIGELLNDPPGFDRAAALSVVDRRVADFFDRHLVDPPPPPAPAVLPAAASR
ncbi:alpha/beta hydrolase family protein [Aquabacterium humicola]|uniref:alpha/beta hydrolase family protein n=1 Tax=Aquabacterium humicola TaxID=3237377 RepID=UPI003F74CE0F